MSSYNVDVYNGEEIVCKITVKGSVVLFKNITKDFSLFPFGSKLMVSYKDLISFYSRRCGSTDNPELICRRNHGVSSSDSVWLQFSDEKQVSYDSIKLFV